MPPLPVVSAGGVIFMLSVPACIHASVCPSMLFSWYLWSALMDFHQTFVSSASWDRDEPIKFGGQKIKGQGHSMTICSKNVILVLPSR